MNDRAASYKIRQVVELTGVSEFLLRVWEDRYMAFAPSRTKTGRRLYTEGDIQKARALLTLTQAGSRIGDVAQLSLPKLRRLLEQNAVARVSTETSSKVKGIIERANQFAWQDVRSVISKERKRQKPLDWIHALIVPLLIEMGRQVDARAFTIAQEHILSAIIRENLAGGSTTPPSAKSRARIVLAAPEGDYHDLGLMIAARIATELRANTLFLGSHMPKTELAAACLRYEATHILLSSTATKEDGAKDDLLKYLNFLDRNLNSKVTVWLAGRNSQKYSVSMGRPSQLFHSFETFEKELKKCLK